MSRPCIPLAGSWCGSAAPRKVLANKGVCAMACWNSSGTGVVTWRHLLEVLLRVGTQKERLVRIGMFGKALCRTNQGSSYADLSKPFKAWPPFSARELWVWSIMCLDDSAPAWKPRATGCFSFSFHLNVEWLTIVEDMWTCLPTCTCNCTMQYNAIRSHTACLSTTWEAAVEQFRSKLFAAALACPKAGILIWLE